MAFIIAAVLLSLLFQNSCGSQLVYESDNITNDGQTVLLGGLFPLHINENGSVHCGDIQEDFVQRLESMVYAINSINDDIELLPKIKLAFSIRDTCSNPIYGLEQAFQFVQSTNNNITCSSSSSNDRVSVSGVVGAAFSRVSIDVANLLRLHQIPQISYISTADLLGDKSRFDYFFRTIPPDSLQAKVIADMIVLFNWTYVFLLYSEDAYGRGGIDALAEHLQMHNQTTICIAAKISLSLDATAQEYDNVVTIMNQAYVSNATVSVLFGHLVAAVGVMQALGRAQMREDFSLSNMTWIATDAWGDSLPEEYHSIARGYLGILPRAVEDPSFDDHFRSLNPHYNSTSVWFNELWELRFGCSLSTNTMCGIARENMTQNATEQRQAGYITLISDAVFSFAHAIDNLVKSRCSNGTLCDDILEKRHLGVAINGKLLRQQLYNVSFQGRSSNMVSFDRSEETGAFFIKNLQQSPTLKDKYGYKIVGIWDHEFSFNFTSDIEWVNGDVPRSVCSDPCEGGSQLIPAVESKCCWSCSPCQSERGFSDGTSLCQDCEESLMPDPNKTKCVPIPVSHLKSSNVWSIVLLILTSVGLVTTAFVIIVFLVFYQHEVVKASSRENSIILLVGLALCFTMPFFFVLVPSPVMCTIRRFGVGVQS